MQTIVVATLMGLFVTAVMVLLVRPVTITGEAGTLLTALLGVLTGKVATIVDFYFGTSKQSALPEILPQSTSKVEVTTTETKKGD